MNREKLIIVLGAALFISLTGNVYMAGLMAGHSFSAHEQHASGDGGEGHHGEWQRREAEMRRQMSPPDREVLKKEMQERRPKFQAFRQQLEELHQKVEDAQNAEPFDQKALDDAMQAEHSKKSELLQAQRQARQEIMQQLSPEGRAIFSKVVRQRFSDGDGPHSGGSGPGPERASTQP